MCVFFKFLLRGSEQWRVSKNSWIMDWPWPASEGIKKHHIIITNDLENKINMKILVIFIFRSSLRRERLSYQGGSPYSLIFLSSGLCLKFWIWFDSPREDHKPPRIACSRLRVGGERGKSGSEKKMKRSPPFFHFWNFFSIRSFTIPQGGNWWISLMYSNHIFKRIQFSLKLDYDIK